MEICCISSCPKPAYLACYIIPTDVEIRRQWMKNINRDQNAPTIMNQDTGAVCSLHFKQNDYIYLLDDDGNSKRKISEDAVPSVFPWTGDWSSNCAVEMEVSLSTQKYFPQASSQTSSFEAGLPEEEIVQLGNVESLGISTHTVVGKDAYLDSSVNHLYRHLASILSTKNTRQFLVNSISSKSPSQGIQLSTSTWTSCVGASEDEDIKYFDILSQISYSCTGCEFKSKDIISLREHRMKHHPQIKPDFDADMSSVKCHGTGTKISSKSPVQECRYNGKEKYVKSCSGKEYQSDFSDIYHSSHKRNSKIHSANEVLAVSKSQTNSKNSDRPSALLSMTNDRQPSKQFVRNRYSCSQCPFLTPNARKLKAHVKENHLVTSSTLSVQSTRLAAHHKDEIETSVPAFLDIGRSYLKNRVIKGHYFYLCPGTNCLFQAKGSRATLHHYQANQRSPLANSDRQRQETDKPTDSDRNKKYSCELCNFSTDDKQRRKVHELRHTEESGYQCSMCSYSVPTKRHLTFHIAKHHTDGLSCDLCDHKAKTMTEKNSHHASVHETVNCRRTSLRLAEQPCNSDRDLECVYSHCSFRTSSLDRFRAHEKTHRPYTTASSTEELDTIEETPRKITRQIKRKSKDRESCSGAKNTKLVERLVYQCPHCNFWARAVSCFHQHLMVHEKTPAFKCSHCDFSARYRVAITRHIKKSSKKSHSSACWVMIKPVSDNQYPEYLKTSLVPELEYSGTSRIHSVNSGKGFRREASSSSSDGSWRLSSVSSEQDSSDEESMDWVPPSSLSSAKMKDGSSSSSSFEITSDSSSEHGQIYLSPNIALSSDSASETKDQTSTKTSSTDTSSVLRSGLVLHSSNSLRTPRRKKLRVDPGEKTDQHCPLKILNASILDGNGKKEPGIPDLKDRSNTQLQIPSDCLKSPFPGLDEALAKRDTKAHMIREAQNRINGMRTEQLKMTESDNVSQLELQKLKGRKKVVNKELMLLNGKKIEAELRLRTQQCQELKLSIAMCNPEEESEFNRNVLAESKNLIAESEAKLTEIKGAIGNLREEGEILDCQIKESEESHAGAAQLVEIFQSEMSEKEGELKLLREELARTVSDITQLVAKERQLIVARTVMCEEELKKLYHNGLSTIREKERDLLSALAGYLEKKVTPVAEKNV